MRVAFWNVAGATLARPAQNSSASCASADSWMLHLDLVVSPALEPEFPGPLALQEAVEEVVVVDVQAVADLAAAQPCASQRHRPLPQPLEVGVFARRMCHTHTVRAEWRPPGSNGERFSSSRDIGWYCVRTVTECGPGQSGKLTGKPAAGAFRLEGMTATGKTM